MLLEFLEYGCNSVWVQFHGYRYSSTFTEACTGLYKQGQRQAFSLLLPTLGISKNKQGHITPLPLLPLRWTHILLIIYKDLLNYHFESHLIYK